MEIDVWVTLGKDGDGFPEKRKMRVEIDVQSLAAALAPYMFEQAQEAIHYEAAQQDVQSDVITRCSSCGTMLTDGGDICFECSNVA